MNLGNNDISLLLFLGGETIINLIAYAIAMIKDDIYAIKRLCIGYSFWLVPD